MKNRVAIYARLSREDEYKLDGNRDSKSVENQIKFLTDYANENDFVVSEIYYDDGYSGGNLNRPGIQNLLADMKLKKFDIVLIKDVSRLGRSLHKVGELIDKVFPENHIRLISVSDKYDSDTYSDDYSIVLRNFLNDYYLKEFKKKCRKSRDYRANNKHMKGMTKFGYIYDDKGNEMIDKKASAIIKKIFNYVANKELSLSRVAELLNQENVMTRSEYEVKELNMTSFKNRYSKQWDRHSVNDIASDYEYCGHSINLLRPKNRRIVLFNTHNAIIDEGTFKKAQEVIAKYRKVGRNGNYNHIANLLKDDKSGHSFVYQPERKLKPISKLNDFIKYFSEKDYEASIKSVKRKEATSVKDKTSLFRLFRCYT